jgi:predicted nucleic acid-binding protein
VSVLIDSCAWIEYFGDLPLAEKYAVYIEKADKKKYVTPSIVLYEVYKKIKKDVSEEKALEAVAYILAYTSVHYLTEKTAIEAAEASLEQGLPMADAIILATARLHNAKIITGDEHFRGMQEAEFIKM